MFHHELIVKDDRGFFFSHVLGVESQLVSMP